VRIVIVEKAQELQCCLGAKLMNYSVPLLNYPSAITAVGGLVLTKTLVACRSRHMNACETCNILSASFNPKKAGRTKQFELLS